MGNVVEDVLRIFFNAVSLGASSGVEIPHLEMISRSTLRHVRETK